MNLIILNDLEINLGDLFNLIVIFFNYSSLVIIVHNNTNSTIPNPSKKSKSLTFHALGYKYLLIYKLQQLIPDQNTLRQSSYVLLKLLPSGNAINLVCQDQAISPKTLTEKLDP